MCGIVGWINYEIDLYDKTKILKKMTDTLAKRGPDTEGFYLNPNAILGHRRLIVVDPEGGSQPMTKRVGEYEYTIVYNGELYNTEDLRKKLLDKGYEFYSYSDTEVLLTAYIEWGPECVDEFNGIYAFGIWDEREGRLFMARDRLGVKPLFYTIKGYDFVFASEIKALLAHPELEAILTDEGVMEIFGLGPARSQGNGVFKGIKELPPGYSLIYNAEGLRLREYWRLESKQHEEDLETTVEHTRSLVVDAVIRQLVSDVPVCTFLSGGLDSSGISAIAAQHFAKEGKGVLETYSIDYVDNDVFFKPTEFQPDADDIWIKKMSQYIGSNHNRILIDTPQLIDALEEAVKANDLPGMADVDSSLYLFCNAVKKNSTVALSGECADEIFGGYPWFRRQEDISANTFPWSKATVERKGLLGKDLSRLPIEEYVHTKYEEALREVPRLHGETPVQHRMREIFYLNLKWFMVTLLNRKDRMSMANGLEVRVPFADHRIVEYAWNIPWEMKFCDEREKGLLRRAFIGILPKEILERKKSPYPKTHNPAYTKALQRLLKMVLMNPASPILQLINKEIVWNIAETGGTAFGKPWFGQLMTGPQLMAYLIQVNSWLKLYKVKIEI